jgi:archaellum component FlaF (FlaF/FlaG flagellin family)
VKLVANIRFKHRRGLSTVVGAVFMIIVTIGALNVVLWTMQQQNRVTEAVIEKSNSSLNKLNEEIDISDIRVVNNKLNLTVTNDGGGAATIKSIYVVNETASPSQQYRYDIDYVVDGRESVSDIGQTLPLSVKDNTRYSIKVVTESGNIATKTMTPLSSVSLPMALYIIPPTFTPGENVTVLYTITNNLTDSELSGPVELDLNYAVGCSPLGSASCSVTRHVEPSSNITSIARGNTALFKWVFEVQIPDETEITFNASLTDAKEGNYVVEKGLSRLIDAAKTSFQSEIVISSTLVQRPELFVTFPSPFGDSSQKGVWGIQVANPTDQPMEITKIIMTIISPRAQSGTSYWSCPAVNMLMWKKTPTGVTLDGRSAMSFLAKVNPGSLATGSIDLESISVDVTVFTSMGQFSKSGYSGSMRNSAGALPQVYLSSAVNSTDTTKMFASYTGVESGTTVIFNATIADFDTGTSHKINSGSRLIIDVPKCFVDVDIIHSGGFTVSGPIEFSDGSWQIIGTLNNDLTGASGSAARTIQFSATADTFEDSRVYVMYILGDGETDGSTAFTLGPISEVPVQVVA